MLESLDVKNFTVFPDARLCFAGGLNVIVGENGLGKTHLLKLPYAVMAVSAEEGRRSDGRKPTNPSLPLRVAIGWEFAPIWPIFARNLLMCRRRGRCSAIK